jgi:hypothetical protein
MKHDPSNGFTYDPDIFNALETFNRLRERFNRAKNSFGKWMLGRRCSDWHSFAWAQTNRVHRDVRANEIETYCSCGLVYVTPRESDTPDGSRVNGHWDHTSDSLAQVYLWRRKLVCAGCSLTASIEFDERGIPLIDWDAALVDHAGCGFLGEMPKQGKKV